MQSRLRWHEAWLAMTLMLLATLAGCATQPPGHGMAAEGGLRYLALGDSYTIGESVAPEARWPAQLAQSLRAAGIAVGDPRIIATTGWTTDELDAAIDAAQPASDFDLVSLLIGVNNQYRGRDLENYRVEFRALLERAIALSGGDARHVLVVSIPDWGVTRFGAKSGRNTAQIAREIDAFNAAASVISSRPVTATTAKTDAWSQRTETRCSASPLRSRCEHLPQADVE